MIAALFGWSTMTLDELTDPELVSEAQFTKVSVAARKSDAKPVVVKELPLAMVCEERLKERKRLEECQHAFVLQHIAAIEESGALHVVLERWCGDITLLDRPMSERAAQFYISELILGVEHLHSLNIAHLCLRPQSVLLDASGHIKVADFDLMGPMASFDEFSAPELQTNRKGLAADWYSLGALCRYLLGDSEGTTLPELPKGVTMKCKNFVSSLMRALPATRLGAGGAADVRAHMFFGGMNFEALLQQELTPPCTSRPSDWSQISSVICASRSVAASASTEADSELCKRKSRTSCDTFDLVGYLQVLIAPKCGNFVAQGCEHVDAK